MLSFPPVGSVFGYIRGHSQLNNLSWNEIHTQLDANTGLALLSDQYLTGGARLIPNLAEPNFSPLQGGLQPSSALTRLSNGHVESTGCATHKKAQLMLGFFVCGAPGTIRTCDPLVRSQVLYPAELRVLKSLLPLSHFHLGSGA